MSGPALKTYAVLAPAKINLYLHVTGRRDDGYHLLDSLVAFADIGDKVDLRPAHRFSFATDGPFARAFHAAERDAGPDSRNLAVRAAWELARLVRKNLDVSLRLTKNLPLAAGLGGGSSDAAAVIWALLEHWEIAPQAVAGFGEMLLGLGADVPACMACRPVRVQGIGDALAPAPVLEEVPILIANPQKPCGTRDVFRAFADPFSPPAPAYEEGQDLVAFLKGQRNDLTATAVSLVPEIAGVLAALERQPGCRLARMAGSGASCFALFNDDLEALDAAENLLSTHPGWWVRAGVLNRPARY